MVVCIWSGIFLRYITDSYIYSEDWWYFLSLHIILQLYHLSCRRESWFLVLWCFYLVTLTTKHAMGDHYATWEDIKRIPGQVGSTWSGPTFQIQKWSYGTWPLRGAIRPYWVGTKVVYIWWCYKSHKSFVILSPSHCSSDKVRRSWAFGALF